MKKSFMFLAAILASSLLFAACTGGGGYKSKNNADVRSIEIISGDTENVTAVNDDTFMFADITFPEPAEFEIVLRDAAGNEITVKDPQNIVWTLDYADTNCFSFLYSSSLSGAAGTSVTVQFYFTPPYDTEAELKVSYGGLSKTIMLNAFE